MLKGFGTSIRTSAANLINDLSPISLFNMQQARKLGADLAHMPMPKARGMSGRKFRAEMAGHLPFGDRIKAYWNGYNLEDMVRNGRLNKPRMAIKGGYYEKVAAQRATTRRVAMGVLGSATLGTLAFGSNNAISAFGQMGLTGAATTVAAGGMAEFGSVKGSPRMGAAAGGALLGWTALNALRAGDNIGPF